MKTVVVSVVGIKDSGKSTAVRELWGFDTGCGFDKSTSLRMYPSRAADWLTVIDVAGHADVEYGDLSQFLMNGGFSR